ncbi:MAG: hypothetical protein IT324_06665 [Anaerolineae bacterium]|nr:hypothetical protein [Anaerolineae bacterium]
MADMGYQEQAQTAPHKTTGQILLEQIQARMRKAVDEFARGEISREQFQQIYEHYQGQLLLTAQMTSDTDSALPSELAPGQTIAIRRKWSAVAKAMAVYYPATGLLLETIGDFDVPVARLTPGLNHLNECMERGIGVRSRVECFGTEWLAFIPGKYSTSIMLFTNEPSARQIAFVEDMHRDFETANYTALRSGRADGANLVYPFLSFVRKSVGMK